MTILTIAGPVDSTERFSNSASCDEWLLADLTQLYQEADNEAGVPSKTSPITLESLQVIRQHPYSNLQNITIGKDVSEQAILSMSSGDEFGSNSSLIIITTPPKFRLGNFWDVIRSWAKIAKLGEKLVLACCIDVGGVDSTTVAPKPIYTADELIAQVEFGFIESVVGYKFENASSTKEFVNLKSEEDINSRIYPGSLHIEFPSESKVQEDAASANILETKCSKSFFCNLREALDCVKKTKIPLVVNLDGFRMIATDAAKVALEVLDTVVDVLQLASMELKATDYAKSDAGREKLPTRPDSVDADSGGGKSVYRIGLMNCAALATSVTSGVSVTSGAHGEVGGETGALQKAFREQLESIIEQKEVQFFFPYSVPRASTNTSSRCVSSYNTKSFRDQWELEKRFYDTIVDVAPPAPSSFPSNSPQPTTFVTSGIRFAMDLKQFGGHGIECCDLSNATGSEKRKNITSCFDFPWEKPKIKPPEAQMIGCYICDAKVEIEKAFNKFEFSYCSPKCLAAHRKTDYKRK